MSNPRVDINIVVHNGSRFIRHCLSAVRAQSYENIRVTILDNASTDDTREIIRSEFPEYRLIEHSKNLGMWPGQEFLMQDTDAVYLTALSVDVILDPGFIANAVAACQNDPGISAVQAKIYQYQIDELKNQGSGALRKEILDTCGYAMSRARKVINIGHGHTDDDSYDTPRQIFGVEGAVPFFRVSALHDCKIQGQLIDPDYFWYGDDLDLAWRMTLLGHQQMLIPNVIAWHDRSTTKGAADIPVIGQLSRIGVRAAIPLKKRRLDWSNVRFTIIKNDYIINILRDLPYIATREIGTFVYTLLFEPAVFLELGRFLRLLPRMLRRRSAVMERAIIAPNTIHRYFT